MTDDLLEDICTFMVISRRILLKIGDVADKICRENQNMHSTFTDFFFLKLCDL